MIVVWQVTERCNLDCPFCSYDRGLARPRRDADPQRIRESGRVLAQYQRETDDTVLVCWLGGEPLLWSPLAELSTEFAVGHGLRVATTTNGTALESTSVRRHLLASYAELTVSVDAPGTAHDALRGAPSLYATLSASVRSLADERRRTGRPLRLRANVVLMRRTIGVFDRLCHELADWGIEEISFNQLGGNDRPEFYPANRLEPASVALLEEHLPRLRDELGQKAGAFARLGQYLRRMAASSRASACPSTIAAPAGPSLFVDIHGRIAPCGFTVGTHGIPVAEIDS
ncbi:MAG: radical SAM protein [Opitutaceae bacterium]|nr:radical SAM protein [Opitutaceae bacterium]